MKQVIDKRLQKINSNVGSWFSEATLYLDADVWQQNGEKNTNNNKHWGRFWKKEPLYTVGGNVN
jgi:hypothetical protein